MSHIKLKSLLNARSLTEAPQWGRTLTLDQLNVSVWIPAGNLTKGTRISNETWHDSPIIEIDVKPGTFDLEDKISVSIKADIAKGADEIFKSTGNWSIYQQNPTGQGAGGYDITVRRQLSTEDIRFNADSIVSSQEIDAAKTNGMSSNFKAQPLYIVISQSNVAEADTNINGEFVIKVLFSKNTVAPK